MKQVDILIEKLKVCFDLFTEEIVDEKLPRVSSTGAVEVISYRVIQF